MRDSSVGSIARYRGVDMGRPGFDAAGKVIDAGVALAEQECDDLCAAGPVMADADDRLRARNLCQPQGQAGHRQVLSLECQPDLARQARASLMRNGLANVRVIDVTAEAGARGLASEAPFDVILLSGSVPEVPRELLQQLKPGGRLATVVGDEPVMRARLFQRVGDAAWSETDLFDTVAPRLQGFAEPTRFHF